MDKNIVETNYVMNRCRIFGGFGMRELDKELVSVEVDLDIMSKGELEESWLRMFGSWAKSLLGTMFSGGEIPVNIKGKPDQVKSFAKTLGREKRYLQNWKDFGLDDPKTYKSKMNLDKSIKGFQRKTGIKWPFK